MQGRMEFGPRALGKKCYGPRSGMQKQLNLKVSIASFRPFAPSVLNDTSMIGLSTIQKVHTCF